MQVSRFAGGRVPLVVFRWCPVFRWCAGLVSGGVCWSCLLWSPDNHTHAHTYARIYARARGFLDSNF